MKRGWGAALAVVLAASGAGCGSPGASDFAKSVRVDAHTRLWLACSGSGPVVLADSGLGIPTQAWAKVRANVRNVRFCAFDRAGVGRSDARPCRCGSLSRNVRDIHALIRAAKLKRPIVLAGHSLGGLDSLLYVRRYPSDVSGLVLVDSPSESAPIPLGGKLVDQITDLDLAPDLRALKEPGKLGDLPMIVMSHGRRTYSSSSAERSWTKMQHELLADSSNTLHLVALGSRHVIQVDQPRLVARAIDEAGSSFADGGRLRCVPAYAVERGRCSGGGSP